MFSQYAQKYWAKGLPAMPLRPNAKVPALNSWQAYCATMPTKEEQARWLESYPDGNIGLPLGPQSGVVALDLDSVDPRVERVLEQIMPHSPWKRVGKKGAVYAFKYNGERTYRIKDENNNTVMEVLSRGAQIVLPPSIHPDTMKPYVSNTELVDVVDKLVPLPSNFEVLIRTALIDAGVKLSSRGSNKVTEWVPSGGRDSAMTAIAGLQARAVSRGERSLLEAMSEMEAWIATYTEKVVGDTLTPEKGRAKVMEFVRRDIADHQRALPSGWDAGMTVEERAECKKYFGDDFEDLNRSQVFDMLTQKFMETPKEDTEGRMAIIDETMLRLAKSAVLTSTDHDMIIQFIQNANGRIVSTGALRKRIKELRGGEHLGEDHTEIALLLIKELERYGEIRYQGTDFYQWRGAHWQRMSTPEIMKVLAENFGSMPAARKHSDHKGILQTMVSLVPNELQTLRMDGINFANGYLTLDLELIDHDPRYGATYCMPYRYAPGEGAPMRFLAFLDQCWGEDTDYMDKVQAVREAIAATLFKKATKYSRAICLFGMPKSGKSTLSDIVQGLVPAEALSNVSPHDWSDKFLPCQMANSLINFAGELSETDLIAGGAFKQIVEGAEMNGQYKGKDIFKFRPLCAQWFASNHLPRTRDTSAGFNRRWLFLHFTKQVTDDQKVVGLAEDILAEEREAIVAWAAPAIQDLMMKSEYTIPESHMVLISEVASQNNSVRFFLTSGGVMVRAKSDKEGGLSRTSERELYPLYFMFCKVTANAQPVQLKRFRLVMQELGPELGFHLLIEHSALGEEAYYVGITTAGKRKAA